MEYGRFVVVGLLGSSALMILIRCWCIKFFVLIGLSALLYIEHQPFTKIPCIGCTRLWEKVAVIGAIIYLMGADCAAGSCKKVCGAGKKEEEKVHAAWLKWSLSHAKFRNALNHNKRFWYVKVKQRKTLKKKSLKRRVSHYF